MTVVITPVGTSLFTNGSQTNNRIQTGFGRIEDKPASEWANNIRYIDQLKKESENFINSHGISASAELQSTAVIRDKLDDNMIVYLLASDTIASRLAAEILRDRINPPYSVLGNQITARFNADPATVGIDVIRNLQVEDAVSFSREGMPKLFQRINYIKDWEAGGNQNLAINITGGYGATLPYLTIFAQLEDVPLYYNFEGATALITIPQVPLTINWELIERYADVISQLDEGNGLGNWRQFQNANWKAVEKLAPFIYVDNARNDGFLSPMGEIFWNDYLKGHFIVDLSPPNGHRKKFQTLDIDCAIRELYSSLHDALSPNYLTSTSCYKRLRELGDDHDLNHTGQVQGQDIFIFKSTDHQQMRLMYTFVVNGRTITRITIFDINGHLEKPGYIPWKQQFEEPHAINNFDTRTFDVS